MFLKLRNNYILWKSARTSKWNLMEINTWETWLVIKMGMYEKRRINWCFFVQLEWEVKYSEYDGWRKWLKFKFTFVQESNDSHPKPKLFVSRRQAVMKMAMKNLRQCLFKSFLEEFAVVQQSVLFCGRKCFVEGNERFRCKYLYEGCSNCIEPGEWCDIGDCQALSFAYYTFLKRYGAFNVVVEQYL